MKPLWIFSLQLLHDSAKLFVTVFITAFATAYTNKLVAKGNIINVKEPPPRQPNVIKVVQNVKNTFL
ncbi:hypothetical protein [Bacillus manliponensis]|uniref:hypothetical protein n=1 Tax=Bacillus manliponensis TaxID=574376 RepID=UPI000A9BA6F9|nr:hypothetical protein [Bacillus manliponensis]